jgi:hypothetical protein
MSYATDALMQGRYAWSHDVNINLWEGRTHGLINYTPTPKSQIDDGQSIPSDLYQQFKLIENITLVPLVSTE